VRLGPELSDDPFARLRRHRYGSLLEDLTEEPTLLVSTMFGCVTCYLHGLLVLGLAEKRPPWRGILVPTVKEHQAALRAELPDLVVHSVIGKWLYLPESAPTFEESAAVLVRMARTGDPRLGVEATLPVRGRGRPSKPKPKRKRTTARATRRR
jgi:hypothetical protein